MYQIISSKQIPSAKRFVPKKAMLCGLGLLLASSFPALAETDLTPVDMAKPPITLLGQAQPETPPNAQGTQLPEKHPTEVPPIVTSRPSFTDAVITVPQGSFQAESGATYTNGRNGTYSWTVPETLMRLGVGKNTELRYTTPTYTYLGDRGPGSNASHFGDMSVGLSQHFMAPGKIDVAIIPILNIPTGAKTVTSSGVDPQLRFVIGKYVTKKLMLSSMMDARWYTDRDAAARVVMTPTFIGYYSLTKKLTGFGEYAAIIPTGDKTAHYAQAGLLYLLTPRQQIDVRMAAGLSRQSPDFLVGFGYSFRVDGLFGSSRDFSSFKPSPAKMDSSQAQTPEKKS